MEFMVGAGIICLIFGALLVFAPIVLGSVGRVCNQVVMYLDEKLNPFRLWIGILLLLIAAWFIYMAVSVPAAIFTVVWVVALVFGLLFLFFPNWLAWLSRISNTVIFSTDDFVMGSRMVIGILLLIIGVYLFFMAYTM